MQIGRKAPSKRLRIVYYLWSEEEGPLRITERMHRQLVAAEVALPRYAGSRQRIIEVLLRPLMAHSYAVSIRGLLYTFDSAGILETATHAEAAALKLSRFRTPGNNVVDLEPRISARRFRSQNTWMPTKAMIDRIRSDLDPHRPKGSKRFPVLRP